MAAEDCSMSSDFPETADSSVQEDVSVTTADNIDEKLSFLEPPPRQRKRGDLFICRFCEKVCASSTKLREHESIHTGEKLYECGVCFRKLSSAINLKHHQRLHTRERPFQCDQCPKSFTRPRHLTVHKMSHTDEREFGCVVCGKEFRTSTALMVHMRIHTGERPYSCTVCQKRFITTSAVAEHMKVHTDDRPHNCEVCGKGFRNTSALNRHRKIHTTEKPYQCNLCLKMFAQELHLAAHLKRHEARSRTPPPEDTAEDFVKLTKAESVPTVKRYECHVCGLRVESPSKLEAHMRVHSGEKPYQCGVCGKRFTAKRSCIDHEKRLHMSVDSENCTCDPLKHKVDDAGQCVKCGKSRKDEPLIENDAEVISDEASYSEHSESYENCEVVLCGIKEENVENSEVAYVEEKKELVEYPDFSLLSSATTTLEVDIKEKIVTEEDPYKPA